MAMVEAMKRGGVAIEAAVGVARTRVAAVEVGEGAEATGMVTVAIRGGRSARAVQQRSRRPLEPPRQLTILGRCVLSLIPSPCGLGTRLQYIACAQR